MLRIISLLVSILVVFNPINTNAESDLDMPAYQKSKVNQTELGIKFGYKGCFGLHSNPNEKNNQHYSTTKYPFVLFFHQKLFYWNTSIGIETSRFMYGNDIRILESHKLKNRNRKITYTIDSLNVTIPISWWFLGYHKNVSLHIGPHLVLINEVSMEIDPPFSKRHRQKDNLVIFDQFNLGASIGIRYCILNMFSVASALDYFHPNINKANFHLFGIEFTMSIDILGLYHALFTKNP